MSVKKVYTLLLEGENYYVGITKNVLGRFEAHYAGTGASWTKLHKPIEIIAVEEAKTPFDEDRVVKTLMHEHGIEKVRGGSYVTVDLSAEQIKLLRKEITMSTGACIICGEMGHMAKACPSKAGRMPCARCGRAGHDVAKCYAKKTKTGELIVESVSCIKCGWGGHEVSTCFAKKTKTGEPIEEEAESPVTAAPPRKKAPKPVGFEPPVFDPPMAKKDPDTCNIM